MRLDNAIAEYLTYITRLNYAAETIEKHARFFGQFQVFIGCNYPEILEQVELTPYRALVEFLNVDVAPKTRCNQIGMLRSFGKCVVQELDLIFTGNNPYLRLRRPKLPVTVPRAPESSDLIKALSFPIYLRKAARYDPARPYHRWMNERNRLILFTLTITGIRRGEMSLLRWCDAPGSARLLVRGKGNKERVIPLPPALATIYGSFRQTERARGRGRDVDQVLWAHKAGREKDEARPMCGKSIYEICRDVLDKRVPEWDRVTPHTLRHAALTALVEADADIVTVAAIAGHNNIQTTFRNYVAPRDKRKAAALQASALTRLADVLKQ